MGLAQYMFTGPFPGETDTESLFKVNTAPLVYCVPVSLMLSVPVLVAEEATVPFNGVVAKLCDGPVTTDVTPNLTMAVEVAAKAFIDSKSTNRAHAAILSLILLVLVLSIVLFMVCPTFHLFD